MNVTSLAMTLAGFGLVMILIGCRHLWKVHTWRPAAFNIVVGTMLIVAAVALFMLFLNLSTYSTLRYQTPVAEVSFTELKNGQFTVRLMRIPSGSLQVFTVTGDEWRVRTHTLTWQSWPRLLGMQTKLRLQAFVSRHAASKPGAEQPERNILLSGDPGPNLWEWAAARGAKAIEPGAMNAGILDSPFIRMADGARYRLIVTPDGVDAEAVNRSASSAMDDVDSDTDP
jgi:hypothetical protein